MWVALRTFKDDSHAAWADVSEEDTEKMWKDLAGMGVTFEDGIMPPYEKKKKAAAAAKASGENGKHGNGPSH